MPTSLTPLPVVRVLCESPSFLPLSALWLQFTHPLDDKTLTLYIANVLQRAFHGVTMHGYCPLASGSKGNCTYLGTREAKVLIDAGLSFKMIGQKLAEIGVGIEEIDAVIVTHEHSDHIRGLKTLTQKLNIPIYANTGTARGILNSTGTGPRFKIFATGETFALADLEITPFSIQHDSLDPVAFAITYGDVKIGVCTDLGFVTATVRHHLQQCDYLIVEANHHPPMVYASARPDHLKRRILGPGGHISNEECGSLVVDVWNQNLKQIHLAHLSEECNNSTLALQMVREALAKAGYSTPVAIAEQHQVSEPVSFNIETAAYLA